MRTSKFLTLVTLASLGLSGCDLSKNYTKIDREGDMEFQDYRDAMAGRLPEGSEEGGKNLEDGVPDLMSYVAPLSDDLKPMPLVSISINQTVPLRDALFELAEQADYDLELDPNIKGSIIFTAREKPFDLVIKKIADVAGLRYKFEDNSLRVELDQPYNKSYKIDYLNIIRTNASAISTNISVVSGEGADTGSKFSANTASESNFWSELESNLAQILDVSSSVNSLRTAKDPQLNVVAPQPVPVQQTQPAGASADGTTPAADGTTPAAATPAPVAEAPEPPQAVLQVDSLPAEGEDAAAGGTGADDGNPEASFSLNKQAGLIVVYANDKRQKEVEEYLQKIRRAVTTQVLIEAKVLEVSLKDEFSAGIDWRATDIFDSGIGSGGFGGGTVTDGLISGIRPPLNPVSNPSADFAFGVFTNDFTAATEAVSRFGTVKSLASPRLTVLNNQSAALNVANNLVYFEIEIDSSTTEFGTETDIESEIKNVPEGVLINVQPSIDYETGQISMAIRPTITRVEQFVADPGIAFAARSASIDDIESLVPVVNVQEIDTVINMQSGEAVVMGGLMQDRTESQQNGIPVMSEIPVVGSLFRNQGDSINKTELVIFIKATIIDGSNVHNTDKDLYRMFSGDRRPFKM